MSRNEINLIENLLYVTYTYTTYTKFVHIIVKLVWPDQVETLKLKCAVQTNTDNIAMNNFPTEIAILFPNTNFNLLLIFLSHFCNLVFMRKNIIVLLFIDCVYLHVWCDNTIITMVCVKHLLLISFGKCFRRN